LGSIIDQIDHLEEEAKWQMNNNWGDEKACTFYRGYIEQPVYACVTCQTETGQKFGFCYGCSMNCHLNHEVIEIFFKRNFKCDCPTMGKLCSLELPTSEKNLENKYNHNFDGKYCWCDSEYEFSMEMTQCFFCQEWYHNDCIRKEYDHEIPEEFEEFFCIDCVSNYEFLRKYTQSIYYCDTLKIEFQKDCLLPISVGIPAGNLFLRENWRTFLCQCDPCTQLYIKYNIMYLFKEDNDADPIPATEHKTVSLEETAFELLSKSDHATKIEMTTRYSTFKNALVDYLKPFAQEGRIVSQQDISEFLLKLTEGPPRKKRRIE